MPKKNGIGYSNITPIKQIGFRQIISSHIPICEKIIERYSIRNWCDGEYTYIDLNAGCGRHPETGELGSPLIFIEEAAKYKNIDFHVYLYEKEFENMKELFRRMKEVPKNIKRSMHIGDNKSRFPELFDYQKKKKFGLIYNDPSGEIPDFDLLAEASYYFDKMDILINCPAATIKRRSGLSSIKNKGLAKKLSDYLKEIDKKYWIFRRPFGKHQWTLLIGTNYDSFPKFKKLGFYDLNSNKGQKIFEILDSTGENREKIISDEIEKEIQKFYIPDSALVRNGIKSNVIKRVKKKDIPRGVTFIEGNGVIYWYALVGGKRTYYGKDANGFKAAKSARKKEVSKRKIRRRK